jgi:hypothetical protein
MALWSGYPAEGIVWLVIAPAYRQAGGGGPVRGPRRGGFWGGSRQPGCLVLGVSSEAENGKEVRRHSKSLAGGSTSHRRPGDGDRHNGIPSSQKC